MVGTLVPGLEMPQYQVSASFVSVKRPTPFTAPLIVDHGQPLVNNKRSPTMPAPDCYRHRPRLRFFTDPHLAQTFAHCEGEI